MPRGVKGPWEPSDLEAAVQAVLEGGTYRSVAAKSGISVHTINMAVLRRQGLRPPARSTAPGGLLTEAVAMSAPRTRRKDALTKGEREQIRVGIALGHSDTVIAESLGRHRSTIWREISLNGARRGYSCMAADKRARQRARRPKRPWSEERPWLFAVVFDLFRTKRWSPEQISHWLRNEHPDEPQWWVSHESIYQALFVQAKGEFKKEIAACLRSGRARRRPRTRTSSTRGAIPGMVNVSQRPAEVADRAVPGHWEGDLIIGKGGKSAVATLVERSTRFGMLIKLENHTAEHVAAALTANVVRLPQHLMRSLTWDSHNACVPGREMGLTRLGIGLVPCLGSVDLPRARGRAPAGRTNVT